MDRKSMAGRLSLLLLAALAFSAPLELVAQVPVDENGEPLAALDDDSFAGEAVQDIAPLTAGELEELVGPVALYPDDLLAIVLPASTYPLEIVQAARFLDELGTDGSLKPDESWDESVVALLNYPEVVHMMDKEIDWTWRLGEAVISQQADVIAAVESFRDRAYAAGNLESDEYQTVSNDNGAIEIEPADEEIIYVPYYEPEEVVVYQPRRVYYYYPHAYPVYYYPYPVGYSFASGYFWGVTTAFTIGWSNHYLHVHHPSYWGHPYYGHHYYGHFYRRPSISLYNSWYVHSNYRSSSYRHRDGDHWRPRQRSGARPASQRVRNYHYPSGGRDNDRSGHRSSGRFRQEVQDRNRTRIVANNSARERSGGAPSRSRQSATGTENRSRIANPDARRIERGGNRSAGRIIAERDGRSEIRFRDRDSAEPIRANRSSSSGRQRLTARNSRQTPANSQANRDRRISQRAETLRQPTTSRTASRSSSQRQSRQRPTSRPAVQRQAPVQRQTSRPEVQRQAPVQRQTSRPAVQRQAPVQRQTSRRAVQRQAPAQRSAPPAAPQRQSGTRKSAPSSNRGRSSGRRQPR